MDSLEPGTLLARRYRLTDRIGVGGMSVIWRAHDEMLERGVAVKVLAADLAADPRFRQRVRDEARSAAALVHPRITATYDYGEAFDADGAATAYVVMELLGGEPLSARLTAGPLPWPEALRTGAEVAEALATAHRHGIVHRDITSDNIMLTGDGAKVLDFGIATTIGAPDEDIDGSTFGTPAYVAPERLDGQRARPATDTYALGVLLYEMLAGSPPYPADTWEELAATPRQVPPALEVPGLPQPVAELCYQCLAREPRHRPTANQVAWTLRKHLPGAGRSRRAVALRRALVGAGVAAALALGVVVGATLLSSQPPATPLTADDPPASLSPPTTTPGDGPTATSSPRPSDGDDPPPSAVVPNRPPSVPGEVPNPVTPSGPDPVPDPDAPTDEPVTFDAVGDIVANAEASGDLREDVADDLTNMISNLEQQLDNGSIDLPYATAQLRDKVDTREDEGALAEAVAQDIYDALNQLVT